MPIPNSSLDNKSFQELVEEAKKKISAYSRVWTDYNVSDPGITFIELFAWLAEMQIYRLNKITEKNYLKFLKLLCVKPHQKKPSKIDVTITANKDAPINIKKGTQLKSTDLGPDGIFETDEEITILPLTIKKICSFSKLGYIDETNSAKKNNAYFYAFGEEPQLDNSFFLGLDLIRESVANIDKFKDELLTIRVYLYENDLPEIGKHDFETPSISLSCHITWEYFTSQRGWINLDVQDDNTNALTNSGEITIKLPFQQNDKGKIAGFDNDLYWIRCRITSGQYEIPPRISSILLNTISASHGDTQYYVDVGQSNGLPDQIFEIKDKNNLDMTIPILKLDVKVVLDDQEISWKRVDDFDGSGPDDLHYTANFPNGSIQFGNGVQGRIPPVGGKIVINYTKLLNEVFVKPETTFTLSYEKGQTNAINYLPSTKEIDNETIEESMARTRSEINTPFKAVSSNDFEYLSIHTPGLRVARTKAFVSDVQDEENTVSIIVVPFSFSTKPIPSIGFLDTVCRHLDKHRLITTKLKVIGPDYVGISVNVNVTIKQKNSPENVKERIKEKLDSFLSPISRNQEQNAWPFGRDVFKSEIYSVIEEVEGVDCIMELNLSGSGKSDTFENKDGNVTVRNNCLVYLEGTSINIASSGTECMACEKK